MSPSIHSRALQKAAEILGGRRKLAEYLRVPLSDLEKWIAGKAKPPAPAFLQVVELIIDEASPSASSEPGESPPRDCSAGDGSRRYSS